MTAWRPTPCPVHERAEVIAANLAGARLDFADGNRQRGTSDRAPSQLRRRHLGVIDRADRLKVGLWMGEAPPSERPHLPVHHQWLAMLIQILRLKGADGLVCPRIEVPVRCDRIAALDEQLLQLGDVWPLISLAKGYRHDFPLLPRCPTPCVFDLPAG